MCKNEIVFFYPTEASQRVRSTALDGADASLTHCMGWSLCTPEPLHVLVIKHDRPTSWVGHYTRKTHSMGWSLCTRDPLHVLECLTELQVYK